MKVLKLSLVLGLLLAIVYVLLRMHSEAKVYAAYDHPLLKTLLQQQGNPLPNMIEEAVPPKPTSPLLIAYGGDGVKYPSHSALAIESALDLGADGLMLDVWLTTDEKFVVLPKDHPIFKKQKSLPFSGNEFKTLDPGDFYLSAENTKPFSGQGHRYLFLQDLLSRFAKAFFILKLHDNTRNIDLLLKRQLDAFPELSGRIILASDFDLVIRSCKKLLPQYIFSSGLGEASRILIFTNMGLPGIPNLSGDVFLSPLRKKRTPLVNSKLKQELSKRQQPLILGPLNLPRDVFEANHFAPEAVVLADFALLAPLLKEEKK